MFIKFKDIKRYKSILNQSKIFFLIINLPKGFIPNGILFSAYAKNLKLHDSANFIDG